MSVTTLVAQTLLRPLQTSPNRNPEYLPYRQDKIDRSDNTQTKKPETKDIASGSGNGQDPTAMAQRQDQHSFPLFIEPYNTAADEGKQGEDSLASTVQRIREARAKSPDNVSRCIIDRLRTIKLDTPALRRAPGANSAATFPPRGSSLNALAVQNKGEESAFAATSKAVRAEPSAFASTSMALNSGRLDSHGRQGSLQQRRQHVRGSQSGTHGSLTIQSPTARQASISRNRNSRPAGPMIWLPDEQVWLLADPDVMSGPAAPSGIAYPLSAPLDAPGSTFGARSRSPPARSSQAQLPREGTANTPEGHRLTRSDSSPIRSQFLNLIRPSGSSVVPASASHTYSYSAQDWTRFTSQPGPSAMEEDAVWYADQQARASQHRDQDRFFPLLQQAMTGVDLPLGGAFGAMLGSPGSDISPTGGIRHAATSVEVSSNIRRKRSGSLRSRVSNIGNDDDAAVAASMHLRDLREQGTRRRRSESEIDTPAAAAAAAAAGRSFADWIESDEQDQEWLASLAAQGIVPDGLFTPRESLVSVSSSTAASGFTPYYVGRVPEERERRSREGKTAMAGANVRGDAVDRTVQAESADQWFGNVRTPNTATLFSPLSPDSAAAAEEEAQSSSKAGNANDGDRLFSVSSEGGDSGGFKDREVSPVSTRANSIVQ